MISIPGSLSLCDVICPCKKSAGDARCASQDPLIHDKSHKISTQIRTRSAFFLRRTQLELHSFYFIRTIFIRTLRLRFAPKFKKMYGLKLEHPQAQPNCTCSHKKKSVTLFFQSVQRHYITDLLDIFLKIERSTKTILFPCPIHYHCGMFTIKERC